VSEDRENSDFISPDQLPHGWELLPLKDLMAGDKTAIKRGPFGSAIKKSFFVSGGYKVYEQKNAIYDDATLGNYFVNPETFAELRNFEVKPGDFIISCSGTIGRISRLPPNAQPGVINQALLKLTIDEGRVHPKYFLYLFRSHRLQQLVLKDTRGSAMKNLASVDDLKQIRLPLPPFKQQEIIVAEIEKQFSRLDEAVANLKRVKANLKRYKAAVLKAAVEGKLTEEWRKAHPDVEPASELLKRILAERRAKWNGKGKYKERKIDVTVECTEGWVGVTVEMISEIVDGDRGREYPKQEDFHDEGYCLFLTTKNVRPYGFVFKDNQFISKEKHEKLRKGTLKPGDIVFTSRGTIGNIAHYTTDVKYKCVRINSGMFILRGFQDLLDEGYFAWYLRSKAIRDQIARLRSGTAQPQLPIREFKTFIVHFPSKLEQKEIVKEIERRISIIDGLESSMMQAERRADRLHQSVLRIAFNGLLGQRGNRGRKAIEKVTTGDAEIRPEEA